MTRERWIALAVGAVTIIITLLLLAVLETQSEPLQMQMSRYEPRMIELDKLALDQAYATQAAHVFGIWIKDGVGDPARARVGFANARKGYDAAMTAITVREQRLQEQPK